MDKYQINRTDWGEHVWKDCKVVLETPDSVVLKPDHYVEIIIPKTLKSNFTIGFNKLGIEYNVRKIPVETYVVVKEFHTNKAAAEEWSAYHGGTVKKKEEYY